jgi:hypothetical protein
MNAILKQLLKLASSEKVLEWVFEQAVKKFGKEKLAAFIEKADALIEKAKAALAEKK